MTKTTIYLPDKLKRQIERVAKREKKSEAEIIRDALSDGIRWRRTPRPRVPLIEQGLGDPTISERVDEILRKGFGR